MSRINSLGTNTYTGIGINTYFDDFTYFFVTKTVKLCSLINMLPFFRRKVYLWIIDPASEPDIMAKPIQVPFLSH